MDKNQWQAVACRTEGFVIMQGDTVIVGCTDEYGHYGPLTKENAEFIVATFNSKPLVEAQTITRKIFDSWLNKILANSSEQSVLDNVWIVFNSLHGQIAALCTQLGQIKACKHQQPKPLVLDNKKCADFSKELNLMLATRRENAPSDPVMEKLSQYIFEELGSPSSWTGFNFDGARKILNGE